MGTIVDVPGAQKLPSTFDKTDRAKISNIVEICKVSVEEATRVLVACRMDEKLAIDRFLSGEEKPCAWSQVSKRKKMPVVPPQRSHRSSSTSTSTNHPSSEHPRATDTERHNVHQYHPRDESARSARFRHRHNRSNASSRRGPKPNPPGGGPRRHRRDTPNELHQPPAPSEPIDSIQKSFHLFNIDSEMQPEDQAGHSRDIWAPKPSNTGGPAKTDGPSADAPGTNGPPYAESPISNLALNHQPLNYAAIVATNPARSKQPEAPAVRHPTADSDRAPAPVPGPQENSNNTEAIVDVKVNPAKPPARDVVEESKASPSSGKQLPETQTQESTAASNQGEKTDPVVLQFGSFGFSSLDASVWSRNEKVEIENSPKPMPENAVFHSTLESNAPPAVANPVAPPPNLKQLDESVLPKNMEKSTTQADGSSFPPVVAHGVTGAFPAPNFAPPYMMPPLPYASAINGFDAASDLSSSRNPVTPLTVYDHNNIGLATANGSKMGNLPGLHDNYSLPNLPAPAKHPVQPGLPEQDKSNGLSSNPAVQGSLDGMYMIPSYSYIMPSYPSMQYPPPHGIAPHNHSHFAYTTMGPVSTPAGFNPYHSQSTNVASNAPKTSNHNHNHGNVPVRPFEENTQNAGSMPRNNVVLMNESTYGPNSYLSSTENVLNKTIGDTSTFKSNRLVQGNMGTANFPGVNLSHNGNGLVPGSGTGTGTGNPNGSNAYDFNVAHTLGNAQQNVGGIGAGAGWNNQTRQVGTGQADPNPVNNAAGYYPGNYY